MAFTDLATVKILLSIPPADTTNDALLTALIGAVDAQMLELFWLDTTDPTSYTNSYDIDDSDTIRIVLRQYPVISFDEIKFDGTVQTLTEFYLRNPTKFGRLGVKDRLTGLLGGIPLAAFPFGRQFVEVTHTAGWVDVPGDLAYVAGALVMQAFNIGPKAGFDSEKIGQYNYRLKGAGAAAGGLSGVAPFPPLVQNIFASHLRRITGTRN